MTLILGMSKAEGIYLSVDCRVTDPDSGTILNDATVKFVTVYYVDGPKALLAYTGIAWLPNRTRIGNWLRQRITAGPSQFNDSMHYVRDRLDRDIAPFGMGLIVNVIAVHGDHRYFDGFSNIAPHRVTPTFQYQREERSKPFSFGNGAGALRFFSKTHVKHLQLISDQLSVQPRHPHNHMNLLASVSRHIADRESSVSPHCHVSFINADSRFEPAQEAFPKVGPSTPIPTRIVDLTS